jgi:hypothetical protein
VEVGGVDVEVAGRGRGRLADAAVAAGARLEVVVLVGGVTVPAVVVPAVTVAAWSVEKRSVQECGEACSSVVKRAGVWRSVQECGEAWHEASTRVSLTVEFRVSCGHWRVRRVPVAVSPMTVPVPAVPAQQPLQHQVEHDAKHSNEEPAHKTHVKVAL